MFKRITDAIKFGAAYAVGVSDGQMGTRARQLFDEDPNNHVLHGLFEPIFSRHIDLLTRNNKQSKLIQYIDTLIKCTGLDASIIYRSVCFNFTVDSIFLFLPPLSERSYFTKEALSEYIEREWRFFDSKFGLEGHKSQLVTLLTSTREKIGFASKNNLDGGQISAIYAPTSKIGSYAFDVREPNYFFGGKVLVPDLIQIWRWIFGPDKDALYERHVVEFGNLYSEFQQSTIYIMALDKDPEADEKKGRSQNKSGTNDEKHSRSKQQHSESKQKQSESEEQQKQDQGYSTTFSCPTCRVTMRLKLPINLSRGRCGKCKAPFVIKADGTGRVWLEAVHEHRQQSQDHGKQSSTGNTSSASREVEDALMLLGLSAGATKAEIKSAYRKKVSEYHPDKVQGLGVKIQKIALEETQNINKAVDVLRVNGLL